MEDVAAPVLLAHELMSSLHLYAVVHSERHTDACSVVGGRQAKSVEHHEEVSCTGRRALVCTRVLGPHNVLDTIGTFGCRTILIALEDV